MVPVQAPKILAVCFAIMGVLMVVWGVIWSGDDLYDAAGPWLVISGAIMIAVAIGLGFLARRLSGAKGARDALVSTGIPAEATVLSIRETGISFRSGTEVLVGFELEVRMAGRPPYNAALEQGVPRIMLGGVLPGSVVVVRVDPADPLNVAIDFSVAPRPAGGVVAGGMPAAGVPGMPTPGVPGMPAAPMAAAGAAGVPQSPVPGMPPVGSVRTAKELLASGRRGTATVVSAQDMGMTVAQTGKQPEDPSWLDDRIFMFVLQVSVDGQPPYTAQIGHRVPDAWLPRIAPGLTLPVAVDPVTPALAVAIDWGGL
jgi:hypothetical protein